MTKDELRHVYRQKRLALSAMECRSRDISIVQHLQRLDWSDCHYLHVYRAIQLFNEPDLSGFALWLKTTHPHVDLVVSRSNLMDNTMLHYVWDEDTVFVENKWGIPEPVGGAAVDVNLLDVVLVPMLVADRKGHRIGYGKGFYDRFLARCRPDVRTIGVSYFDVLQEPIDAGAWDIPLRKVVTPDGVFAVE